MERPDRMVLRDVEVPEVGPDDILVRVRVCGISELDRRLYTGECDPGPEPIIPGDEVLGTIEAMGAEVRGFDIGDRICVDSGFRLGACIYVRQGGSIASAGESPACLGTMGGFAEFMLAPASRCFAAPEQVDDYTASQAAHVVHQFRTLQGIRQTLVENEPLGASCVILGSRAGLMLTAMVRFLGFAPIVVVGAGEQNLDASVRMGADISVDSERVRDPLAAALEALGPRAADVVIDVHGEGEARRECERLLAPGGRLYSLRHPDAGDTGEIAAPVDVFAAVFKLLRYERINPRPAYSMAVPLENVEWALREWHKDARLLKAFMSTALREDFFFEHYRSPVDATLYAK
ncbi:MAG: alcohol dehydrogenase catalytic domain-containing protein [Clostridia bacterium]|nr:alcohol dehydrogenase catalytic domain-containing protein [Clostridia bacterium]